MPKINCIFLNDLIELKVETEGRVFNNKLAAAANYRKMMTSVLIDRY